MIARAEGPANSPRVVPIAVSGERNRKLSLPAHLPPVSGHPRLPSEILTNPVSNAIKVMVQESDLPIRGEGESISDLAAETRGGA